MRVDAYATESHYLQTIAPVWQALPLEMRGTFYLAGQAGDSGEQYGVGPVRYGHPGPRFPTIVASYSDERVLNTQGGWSIYLEHGAGQTYLGRAEGEQSQSYSGGPGHERVALFVGPNRQVAARWKARYPDADVAAVGVPRLDWAHRAPRDRTVKPERPVVAVTFHSDTRLCPETVWTRDHFEPGLAALAAAYPGAIGHGHPRVFNRLVGMWRDYGFEPVREFDEVIRRADVLLADNTSALPEAASCGIPLVFLNGPGYDRSIHHGGRFWEWPEGQVSCDTPDGLVDAAGEALRDPRKVRLARQRMVKAVYIATDGHAAQRAAQAVCKVLARRWPDEEVQRAG